MKEIVVLSGKGGTGKTTVTSSLVPYLSGAVLADCDVDAPDLDVLFSSRKVSTEEFVGGKKAFSVCSFESGGTGTGIGDSLESPKLSDSAETVCDGCGLCVRHCKFNALHLTSDGIAVNEDRCEGCGVCVHLCPESALRLRNSAAGHLHVSDHVYGAMVHARLYPGEENSGRLVHAVRQKARSIANEKSAPFILSDGSPGIGCSVMSSLTGNNLAILVTEPSRSAFHDLKRIHELVRNFSIPAVAVINKFTLNDVLTREIEDYCRKESLEVGFRLPFSLEIPRALTQGLVPSLVLPELFEEHGFSQFVSGIADR